MGTPFSASVSATVSRPLNAPKPECGTPSVSSGPGVDRQALEPVSLGVECREPLVERLRVGVGPGGPKGTLRLRPIEVRLEGAWSLRVDLGIQQVHPVALERGEPTHRGDRA